MWTIFVGRGLGSTTVSDRERSKLVAAARSGTPPNLGDAWERTNRRDPGGRSRCQHAACALHRCRAQLHVCVEEPVRRKRHELPYVALQLACYPNWPTCFQDSRTHHHVGMRLPRVYSPAEMEETEDGKIIILAPRCSRTWEASHQRAAVTCLLRVGNDVAAPRIY